MHIVVPIKQVPDTSQMRIDPKTGTLQREGVPSIIGPYDIHAIEAALRLKDEHGGTISVITMGPPGAVQSLRKALSLGCDAAYLITDRAFAAADTFPTSLVLARATQMIMEAHGPVDLVICGKQTIDGDTAQVGPGIATRLNFAQLTCVIAIDEFDPETKKIIRVQRQLETGREIVEAKLPALLTVVKEINEIRYASMPGILSSLQAEIVTWTRESLGLEPQEVGLKGSPTIVHKVYTPSPRQGNGPEMFEVNTGNLQEVVTKVAEKIVPIVLAE